MILSVVFYAFVSFAAIQIIYYLAFTSFLFSNKKETKNLKEIPVSIIICAKNEAKNLQKFLPTILDQNYSNFEVVLINNASSDETYDIMEAFKKEHSNIKIIDVENNEAFWGNKKYALTLGIKASKNEHLLFTEANCKPVSKDWISEMMHKFSQEKTIVIGYGKYRKKKGFVNLLIRFDTFLTAIQYLNYVKLGAPYMAVSRNFAYKKSEFFNVNGFINHIKIKSGEADLFIQDAANRKNTKICVSENSFTESDLPISFKSWFHKKRKKFSTEKLYKIQHRFFLRLFFISKVLLLILATILFFFYPWEIILSILLGYYIVQYIVIGFASKKLKESQIIYFLPFLEIGLLIIQFSIFITNLISKPNHWK